MTPPKFAVNDLVRFKRLSDAMAGPAQQSAYWIDGCGAEIPEGCMGLIVSRHPADNDVVAVTFLGWSYDVYVLESVSADWGEFALEPIA